MAKTVSDAQFDELKTDWESGGVGRAFERLAAQLLAEKRYHELFDARLLEARHRLGLPLSGPTDDLPIEQQHRFDEALLGACVEVGDALLADGKITEAWRYLRHANQKRKVAEALAGREVDEEELDELVELAVHERVAPSWGFEQVLNHYGTCNAVTLFEQVLRSFAPVDRGAVAARLLEHLHAELKQSLTAEISRQEGSRPVEKTVAEIIADRDWLFLDDAYHIDTSHLNMVVRFAVWTVDPNALRLGCDLCAYGARLSPQFHYSGDEPFVYSYNDHLRFFQAQLGQDVESHLEFFRGKAENLPVDQVGTVPAEVYVALLSRLGRASEALSAAASLIPSGAMTLGLAPNLVELAEQSGGFAELADICRNREDRQNFLLALARQTSAS